VVAGRLAAALSPAVKGVLVEHNYIDKDYRSTYYGFYAKKGKRYGANCVRLHLFDATVTYDAPTLRIQTSDSSRKNALTDHYFGYVVLRPTTVATIGRSVIAPGIRRAP